MDNKNDVLRIEALMKQVDEDNRKSWEVYEQGKKEMYEAI